MSGLLSELGNFLETAAVATEGGVGIPADPALYLGSMADSPDTALCIYAYPGGAPEYVQESFGPSREKPQIQVVARAIRYEDADELITAAWNALSPVTNASLGITKYLSVRPNGSPAFMKRDTNDRVLMFFNASVDKEVSIAVLS